MDICGAHTRIYRKAGTRGTTAHWALQERAEGPFLVHNTQDLL